jgi:hypothetical protein
MLTRLGLTSAHDLFWSVHTYQDRICCLVIRVPGCRGPGFDSRSYHIFCVALGMDRGQLSPCEDKLRSYLKENIEISV